MERNDRRWVNLETGEVIENVARIYTDENMRAIQAKKENDRVRAQDGRHFVQCYHEPIKGVSHQLSLIESGAVLKLLPYMRMNGNGELVKNGEPLSKKDIEKILGRGKDATRDITNRLEEIGVLECEKKSGAKTVYRISPEFHNRGSNGKRGEAFTKLMTVEARPIIERLSLRESGLLYKAIPWFHHSQYMLTANPDSKDDEILEPLSREELAKECNCDPDTVTELMQKLKRKRIVATFSTGRAVHFYINPTILYRSIESKHYRTVVQMFRNFD